MSSRIDKDSIEQLYKYRFQHRYLIGQTLTGKSHTMRYLALRDIRKGHGVLFLDLLGDDIDKLVEYIPKYRLKDVAYIDFSDTDYPASLNFLADHEGDYQATIAEFFVENLSALWNYADTSTPDMDRTIYNTTVALMDYPKGTIVGMYRMLIDDKFRKRVAKKIKDIVIRNFWTEQFPQLQKRESFQTTKSTINKLERFVADPRIRNTLGQSRNTLSFTDILDPKNQTDYFHRKIVLIKIPQSIYGQSKVKIIATLILAQFYAATQQRNTHFQFHTYLPDAHQLPPDIIIRLLRNAGRNSVSLTLSCQYLGELSQKLLDAFFGSIGTWIIFRIGLIDAQRLEPMFGEDNNRADLHTLPNHKAIIFQPGPTWFDQDFPEIEGTPDPGSLPQLVNRSRDTYATPRSQVEPIVNKSLGGTDEG